MQYEHILGATDFSNLGDLALERAAHLALDASSKLTVMTVLPQPEMPSPLMSHYDMSTNPEQKQHALDSAKAALLERIPADVKASGIEIHLEVRIGDPTDEILCADAQLNPDLIVVATHGRRGWSRLIMGSVSERIVQLAHADVLSVRDRPREVG